MTHTDNKVKWCLNKAVKELEEGKPHRGLIKVEPSLETARNHLEKAKHNKEAANFFYANGYSDWSASAFFYSVYHCFLAIIRKHGYESRNQECTLACVHMLHEQGIIDIEEDYINMLEITKSKDIDHSLIETRESLQYGTEMMMNDKQFKLLNNICGSVFKRARELI